MENFIITNVAIYKAIAEESYLEMVQLLEAGRRPKPDGSEGWIITHDPQYSSFKKAMISIVFTGMWLEAFLHLLIVKEFGEEKFRVYDWKYTYEEKLSLFGVNDSEIVEKLKRFRLSRKELVHEKAHFDNGEIKTAQAEAENAYDVLQYIQSLIGGKLG